MKPLRVGIIGYGAIGAALVRILAQEGAGVVEVVGVLARSQRPMDASRLALVADLQALLACKPDLIVECAGHGAVDAYGVAALQAGCDLMIVSIGSLSDAAREARLTAAAHASGRQIILPAGAIGGIDWLAAAKLAGLTQVTYRARKAPRAWCGTPAEALCDLGALTQATPIFTGSARQAAHDYPKNANVAATVALATLGFDATQVELIADPAATGNLHEIEATSKAGTLKMNLENRADPHNPKTSLITAYSAARAILNRASAICIG